jgi:hypothetical protein
MSAPALSLEDRFTHSDGPESLESLFLFLKKYFATDPSPLAHPRVRKRAPNGPQAPLDRHLLTANEAATGLGEGALIRRIGKLRTQRLAMLEARPWTHPRWWRQSTPAQEVGSYGAQDE